MTSPGWARLVVLACVVGTGVAGAQAASASRQVSQKMVIYSIPTREQYLNHSDDRTRGKGNNPFGSNFAQATAPTKESGSGPFVGDRSIFTFKLFRSTALKNPIGSATFDCTYSFSRNGFCNAVYFLNGGSLVGAGEFSFNAQTFTISITSGTGKFRSRAGEMDAKPAAKHAQRLEFSFVPVPTKPQSISVYSAVEQTEFNNHSDDRARGRGSNPFGNFSQSQSATKEGSSGPFAGDRTIFTFKLFDGASGGSSVGSATLLCQYSFAKIGVCDASYVLNGGTLVGNGPIDFNAKSWSLAITGGTGKYRGRTGDVAASAPQGRQHLLVTLD